MEVVEVLDVLLEVLEVVLNIRDNNEGEGREDPVNTTCSAVIYLVPTRRLMPGPGGPWYQLNTRPANWLLYVQNISEWTGTPWRELMTFMTALPSLQSRQCNILRRKNCSPQILWECWASSRVAGRAGVSLCKYKNDEPLAWQLLQWGRSRHHHQHLYIVLWEGRGGCDVITLNYHLTSHFSLLTAPPLHSPVDVCEMIKVLFSF